MKYSVYHYTRRYMRSTKIRILAAFLAVLIFSLSFLDLLGRFSSENQVEAAVITTGTKASDYMTKGVTGSTTHDGHSVVKSSLNNPSTNSTFSYEYTGKAKSTKVSLYDYKSDREIAGNSIASYYTAYGCEPFDQFNTVISNQTLSTLHTIPSDDNITVIYKGSSFSSSDNVYVYMWTDYANNGWNGSRMTYNNSLNQFEYTFSATTTGYVGFEPTRVIFHNDSIQSFDILQAMTAGHTYIFTENVNDNKINFILKRANKYVSVGGSQDYIPCVYLYGSNNNGGWPGEEMSSIGDNYFSIQKDGDFDGVYAIFNNNGNSWQYPNTSGIIVSKGYTYYCNGNYEYVKWPNIHISESNGSQDLSDNHYKIPLYFGCYYRETQTASEYTGDKKPLGQTFGNNELTAGGPYANFWWQANLGMKTIGSGNDDVSVRGHAAVQGLVDDKLTQDSDLNTPAPDGKLRQDGVELPYFSTSFESAHSDLMKIINNNGAGIDFPFYEIKANADTVRGNVTDSSAEARFYQFNSAESNLQLKGYANNWRFEESNLQITSNNNNPGFFPFNDHNSFSDNRIAVENNVGFGTKFEMRFKLKEDGMVWPVDSDGNDIKDKGKINTMFEFIGDDDLWVFIDGNLVLDLGGCHDQTSGLIDFAEKKAYANKAMNIKAPGNDKNNLGAAVSIQTLEEDAFTNKINGYNSSTGYDKNVTHTMTIFYLERGMMDSNLLVRFNFTPESTFSKMKIAEVTDFSNVNDGLKSYTRQAANKDVFKYTVSNKGTSTSDVVDTGILYPTYDQYNRENHYITEDTTDTTNYNTIAATTLTKTALAYDTVTNTNAVFLNPNMWYNDPGLVIAAWIWKNGENNSNRLYLGRKVSDSGNVFIFDHFPSDADRVKFLRLPAGDYVSGGTTYPNVVYNRTDGITINQGKLYTISSWHIGDENSYSGCTVASSDYSYPVLHYENNTYNPDTADESFKPVANTNYLWEDNFKALKGTEQDSIVGMTGKTNASGELFLMYGTGRPYGDGRESSAEFENSFKPGTITNNAASTMKVVQSDTLYSASNEINNPLASAATTRSRSTYYKTSVQLFDRQSNTLTLEQNRGTDVETTFPFRHVSNNDNGFPTGGTYNAVPDYLTVMLTEVFTNEVRVGAISVTKALANSETGPVQDHTFQLSLTNVFGQTGVNVTDYSSITVTGAKAATLTSDGEFTISGENTATITGIPVGTSYTITEVTPGSYFEYDSTNSTNTSGTIAEGTGANNAIPASTNEVTITNKRKTGDLTLSKSLVGASNASTPPNSTTPFTLRVTLNAPAGQNVILENYFNNAAPTITSVGTTGAIALVSHSSTQYVVDVTVYPKDNVNNNTVTINGIPYGTTVTVSEEQDANKPQATYSYTVNGNAYEQTIETPTTVVNVTNIYRKVTMTKKDDKDTSKTLSGAKYVLVKLKSTAYSGDSLTSETITAFNNATETDFTTSLTAYIDSYSNVLTTSDGIVEVNDAMMTNGLTPGKYFFVELSPPENYKKNNDSSITYKNGESTGTQNKVITISENVPSNDNETLLTIDYYNERKTGTLELEKAVATGSPNETFTFSVELDGSEAVLDLNKYAIAGLSSASYNVTTHKMTGTVSVTSGGTNPTITNIPFGTTYTVDEQSKTDWVKVSTVYSDDNKKIDTEPGTNDKVTITNAKTAEMNPAYLMLYEHINEWRPTEWGDPTFIFKIRDTDSNKTSIVALTVDDDDTLNDKVLSGSVTGKTFTNWKVEATDESESGVLKYQGEYHIDDKGRIKVAPGNYEITRIPVSRYKFVTSATTAQYDTEPSPYTQTENKDGSDTPLETVTITNLQSGKTIDVHYYDEVEYYDKFSHVDTKVNKFYKLDNSKKNTTVKGISISNIPSTSVTTSGTTGTVNVSAYKVFVDGTVDTTAISGSELTIEFDSSISGDFSYSNGTITIQNATTTHSKQVYTLTAKYDNNKFTTTFDIAIP